MLKFVVSKKIIHIIRIVKFNLSYFLVDKLSPMIIINVKKDFFRIFFNNYKSFKIQSLMWRYLKRYVQKKLFHYVH